MATIVMINTKVLFMFVSLIEIASKVYPIYQIMDLVRILFCFSKL